MATEINKYHTSKIYKISSPQCDKFYIGSTTLTLKARMSVHKSNYKRYIEKGIGSCVTSFKVVKFDDAIIELIKNVKCENIKELLKVEGDCIKEHHDRILNKNVAGRTVKEYYEANKDKIKENIKEYYEAHKNEIKECKKEWNELNKDKLKQQMKEYRETHKNEIKQHYELNKDKLKQHYELHKNKINEKFNCDCGGKYTFQNKPTHEKTKKHIDFLNSAS